MALSHHTKTTSTKKILRKASLALVREAVHKTRYQIDNISQELFEVYGKLSNKIHPLLWQRIDYLADLRAETETTLSTEKQKVKFNKLLQDQKPRREPNKMAQEQAKLVYNLSNIPLDDATTEVLAKGFNFAVAPAKIPTEEIICSVEAAIYKLDKDTAETVRQDVSRVIRSAKPPKRNISKEEYTALKKLRDNEDIIILPADKGNATVVMNITEYKRKMETLLADPAYKRTATDPTTYLEKTTRTKINASPLEPEIKKLITPREKSSMCPKLYGLPKIHKPEVPLRPIVSSVGSPVQALARFVAQQLQPFAEQAASYVKNADHLIEVLKNQTIRPTQLLVSFDVVSLFTQIPVDEAIEIIEKKYKPANHLMDLARHCLKNTYFMYENQRYRQTEGAPMGSPLSPVIANLFMEDLETRAISTASLKPDLWLRYVDDTFVIWPHGKEKLDAFLQHLNKQHTKIQFTMEVEENNQLPFLDVLIAKKKDGGLSHTVYRKKTHTNRYLRADSHHHPAQLASVVKTLVSRSQKLADEAHKDEEMQVISQALQANGYSKKEIARASRPPKPRRDEEEKTENTVKTILPYVKGTTDKISRILRRHNIETTFKPHQKIKALLRNPKTKIPLESQGVYEIPCKDCERSYIGQTNRRIEVRREEHKKAVNRKDSTSSLVSHISETGHSIDFENTKTLANIEHLSRRITREAIEIEKRPKNLNTRDDAQRLSTAWKPVLSCRKIEKTLIRPEQGNIPKTKVSKETAGKQQQNERQGPVTRSQAKQSCSTDRAEQSCSTDRADRSCSTDQVGQPTYKKQPNAPNVSLSRSLRPRRLT